MKIALLSISMDLVVLCSATANRVSASYVCMCVLCGCVSATGICGVGFRLKKSVREAIQKS